MSVLQDIDRNMPILVVDNLSAMRRITKNCLRKLGFENVVEAEDAHSALTQMKSAEFKFVITDWNVPGAEGQKLWQALREQAHAQHVPMLVVTAEAQKQAVKTAVSDDSNFIVKPFTANLLQQKMDEILSHQDR